MNLVTIPLEQANFIPELTEKVIKLINLQKIVELSLSHNKITAISDQKSLNSHSNKLHSNKPTHSKIPTSSLSSFNNLQFLYFDHNEITNIHTNAFTDLTLVIHLDLSWNKIQQLNESVLSPLANLKTLKLDHNRIYTLSAKQFKLNPSLVHLDFSSNRIRNLPTTVFHYTKNVHYLNLFDNRLSYPVVEWFNDISDTAMIMLKLNPWVCDCKIYDMKMIFPELARQVQCVAPREVVGKYGRVEPTY